MSKSNTKLRAALSIAIALVIASVFTLSSFAAANRSETGGRGSPVSRSGFGMLSAPTGKLTGTGQFTIDGNVARSGTTILSGSRIVTGRDGYVTIDLGLLGNIELRPDTTIDLAFSKDSVDVSLGRAGSIAQSLPAGVRGQLNIQVENTRVGVSRGKVEIKAAGSARTLNAGDVGALDQMAEVTTIGDTSFTADGGTTRADSEYANGTTQGTTPPAHGTFVSAGLGGIIALAGTATAITLGVVKGRNNNRNSIAPRPSQVLP